MKKFVQLVEDILSKTFLLEMPIGTSSKKVWVDSILRKLVYNRQDTPVGIATTKSALSDTTRETESHEGSRYIFDNIALIISQQVLSAIKSCGAQNSKQSIISNLDAIINKLKCDQDICNQIKQNIVLGLESDERVTPNFFVDISIKEICDFLFDKIFIENDRLQGFSPWNDDSNPQTPNYIGDSSSREDYESYIDTYLPQAIKSFSLKLKTTIPTVKNALNYTKRLIVLSDSETIYDFPLQHKGMARNTRETGLDLKQRLAIAGETSNKGIKSNIIEVDKFNNAIFSFTGSTDGLSQRESDVLEQILDSINNKENITGSDLKKINRTQEILPDNKSLFSFLNKLERIGLVTRTEVEPKINSVGGSKKDDDDFISSLF